MRKSAMIFGMLVTVLLLYQAAEPVEAGNYTFGIRGEKVTLNGEPFKILGLRCSNALVSDESTQALIDHLDEYRAHGVNTVSVYFMGSRFGDVKGYRPDGSLDPSYAGRMGRIIEAADERGMVVLVGCLYWGTSKAKAELVPAWEQADANRAVANTVRWLSENDYRNVFADPDNEGMATRATGWNLEQLIEAAHAVEPEILVASNSHAETPDNADLPVHPSAPAEGKPWLDTEATVARAPGDPYWGDYSKQTHRATDGNYHNYSRIGRYTEGMKQEQRRRTREEVEKYNGHVLASTWLQCGPAEGVDGPFADPGGYSEDIAVDEDIDALHPDAGVRWWLEFVRDTYGPWQPPEPATADDE
jgi:hypothetical protein